MTAVTFTSWDAVPTIAFRPTVRAQAINGRECQLCRFVIEPGTPEMPPVEHEAEQLSVLFGGRQLVRLGDVRQEVSGGDLWHIPARVQHESTLLELPSTLFDFHVPYRAEFRPDGAEPPRGPDPCSEPRFTRWDEEPALTLGAGLEARVLRGERAELRRIVGRSDVRDVPDEPEPAERIVTVVRGRLEASVNGEGADIGPGAVWVVPAGAEQRLTVLEGPIELLDFRDVRARAIPPRQEAV